VRVEVRGTSGALETIEAPTNPRFKLHRVGDKTRLYATSSWTYVLEKRGQRWCLYYAGHMLGHWSGFVCDALKWAHGAITGRTDIDGNPLE
jgi:hypothetical protein